MLAVADHRRIGGSQFGAASGVAASRFGDPEMEGTACGDRWETNPFPAKTKPIRQVAGCGRKALRGVGPRRNSQTKPGLDNVARFSKRTHLPFWSVCGGLDWRERVARERRLAVARTARSFRPRPNALNFQAMGAI